MKKVVIITLNYNGKKDTLEFLESLKILRTTNPSTSLGASYELRTIVVDNGSSDGSVSSIHTQYPGVDILQTGSNLGFARGFNKGLEYAKIWGADYFLVINNDTKVNDPNLLEELIKTARSDPKIGLVSPKIYFAPGFEFQKDRYKSSDIGKVLWYAGGYFDWNNVASVHRGLDEVDKGKYDDVGKTELISGACFLIKKEVLEKVSGFDEKYFLYFEDSDFQKKVTDAGFKKYYNGEVSIYHKVSRSTGIGSDLTDYYHSRNRLIYGMEYGNNKLKFALLREALWLLLFGRRAQRKGILDFFLGTTGSGDMIENPQDIDPDLIGVEYPLKLSIGIVNYNTADLLKKLLISIFKKASGFDPKTMEVIVLDNGSDDNLKEVIKDYLPKIKYLENKVNEGFSKGYNKTIKYSQGKYYLMLNSDIEILENGLSELVKAEDEFKGKVIVGGKLTFPDGGIQDSAFNLPTITGAFKQYFLAKKGAYFMYQPLGENPVKVEGLVMACFLIPKPIIINVGLLDEGLFIFFEDIEYARRLKKFGIPIYFVPKARFIHVHGGSTKRIGKEKSYKLLQKSAAIYHGPLYYKLLSLVLRIGQKIGRVETPRSRWINK